MDNTTTTHARKIDKKHIATAIIFAVKYIPHTDAATLNKFLELVNLTGSFGWITDQQLLAQIRLMMKYVPGTCEDSLLTMVELLDVGAPLNIRSNNMALIASENQPKLIDLTQAAFLDLFTQT